MLSPDAEIPPRTEADRTALREELLREIERLRREFPQEWAYFGDIDEARVLRYVGGRDEPAWFGAEFAGRNVNTVARLADAYGRKWEYDVLYDAFSALVHSRGTAHDVTIAGHTVEVHHPHDPTWFELISYFSLTWHMIFLLTAAKCHVPEMVPQLQQLHTRHREDIASLEPTDFPNFLA